MRILARHDGLRHRAPRLGYHVRAPRRMLARTLPLLLLAASAHASDAVDTRVTFSVSDNDVARGPEKSPPNAPSPSIPNFSPGPTNRLFYDDYEQRDTGFEN